MLGILPLESWLHLTGREWGREDKTWRNSRLRKKDFKWPKWKAVAINGKREWVRERG